MPKTLNQCIINITQGRRITLPSFFECEINQQLLCQQMEDGTFTLRFHSNAPKVKIYGVMVGRTNRPGEKVLWWGVFIDENGNILARKKSSSLDYLRKDLSLPDSKGRQKLDAACGLGLWQRPILVEFTDIASLPSKAYRTIYNLRENMRNGLWPPQSH